MLNSKIRNLFRASLAELAEQLELKVAYPNVSFEPESNEIFLEIHIIPADTISSDLANRTRTYRGLVQINVNAQTGTGEAKSLEIAEKIIQRFSLNTKLSDDVHTVYITSEPTCYNAQFNEVHYSLPVRFRYRLDT